MSGIFFYLKFTKRKKIPDTNLCEELRQTAHFVLHKRAYGGLDDLQPRKKKSIISPTEDVLGKS